MRDKKRVAHSGTYMKTSGRGVPPRIFIRRLSAALGGIRRKGFYYVIQTLLSCVLYSLWIYFVNTFGQSCGHPTLGDSSARRLRSYGGVQRFTDTRRPFGGVDGLSGVDGSIAHASISRYTTSHHEVIVAPAWPGAVGGLPSMDTDPSHEPDARISWPNSRSRSALAEARMCGASAAATTSS